MTDRERLYLFDTTLRDGALTTGVDFSLDDKRRVALMLDRLGVDYVEGGYPGANPLDTEFFQDEADATRPILRFRHDEAAGPLGRQRSRYCRCWRRRAPRAWPSTRGSSRPAIPTRPGHFARATCALCSRR